MSSLLPHATPSPRRARRRARGYTVVEVLSAMTLFAIGAAGVIGMQRVTIQGGNDARRFDVATNIANEWAFRLQRDATFWTLPNQNNPTTSNLGTNTTWLTTVNSSPGVWITPTVPASNEAGMSPAFDIFGRDLAAGTGDHMFCTQYRLTWISSPGTAPALRPGAILRAEVRVFWARLERNIIGNCAGVLDPTPDSAAGTNAYHFVYVTTAIRQNPGP